MSVVCGTGEGEIICWIMIVHNTVAGVSLRPRPEEGLLCNDFSPNRNRLETVPYTLVCDFRPDCCDGSDEDFCQFSPCDGRTEIKCGTLSDQVTAFFFILLICFKNKFCFIFVHPVYTIFFTIQLQCVLRSYACNGVSDCMDGSDEMKCSDRLEDTYLKTQVVIVFSFKLPQSDFSFTQTLENV